MVDKYHNNVVGQYVCQLILSSAKIDADKNCCRANLESMKYCRWKQCRRNLCRWFQWSPIIFIDSQDNRIILRKTIFYSNKLEDYSKPNKSVLFFKYFLQAILDLPWSSALLYLFQCLGYHMKSSRYTKLVDTTIYRAETHSRNFFACIQYPSYVYRKYK